MLVPADIDIGIATHTGHVRNANEDDYLAMIPEASELDHGTGRLFVIADGMGGVSGGAEASRTAVRSLGSYLLHAKGEAPEQRMRNAFLQACRGVYLLSKENARLRDMGTTMTAISMVDAKVILGHVGDSRCLRYRDEHFAALTEDHAVQEPRSLLTRCLGAGQEAEQIDVSTHTVEVGDVFLLMTDGVWNVVDERGLKESLRAETAQEAADTIVYRANANGGPDNATVVVVRVMSDEVAGELREIDLPAEERAQEIWFPEPALSLEPPRWPWLLLAIASVLAVLAGARLFYGVDLITRIADMWGG